MLTDTQKFAARALARATREVTQHIRNSKAVFHESKVTYQAAIKNGRTEKEVDYYYQRVLKAKEGLNIWEEKARVAISACEEYLRNVLPKVSSVVYKDGEQIPGITCVTSVKGDVTTVMFDEPVQCLPGDTLVVEYTYETQ